MFAFIACDSIDFDEAIRKIWLNFIGKTLGFVSCNGNIVLQSFDFLLY